MTPRRRFIVGALGATGALVVGWSFAPPRQRLIPASPLPRQAGESAFNGWVRIGADGRVIVMVPKSEMGQGVLTSLAAVLADELDADWSRVSVVHPPLDAIYNNIAVVLDGLPFRPDDDGVVKDLARWFSAKAVRELGLLVTGGSSSVKDLWLPMREAGASARAMLVAAAAARWQVAAGECDTSDGVVAHPASGRRASYGELAAAAAREPVPRAPRLKDPSAFRFIGRPLARIESRDKSSGRAGFGVDVRLPGMLYAAVQMCPTVGGRVVGFEARAVRTMPGVRTVIAFEGRFGGTGGVAAIADSSWRAIKAARAIEVTWDHGPAAAFDSDSAMTQIAARLDHPDGFVYHRLGDVDAALAAAERTIAAEYRAPLLAHTTMEPMNCTVLFAGGRATVWAPTQVPGLARRAAAAALGIAADRVDVRVQSLGGGFGRRLDVDFVAQAATIARALEGTPVQTLWTREEDTRHDFYRPMCVSRFKAGFDAAGRLVAWRNDSAGPAPVRAFLARQFGLPQVGPDKTASEGAFDQPYEFAATRVAHEIVEIPVPVGFWRSVGHSHHAFFKESFLDEAARAAGADPVAFRAGLLRNHPRHRHVLERVASLSGWGSPSPPAADGAQTARGVALHESFGTVVAQVAEVSVDAGRRIRVHRVFCVVDCGTPVNPNLIRQQVEGGIIYGLTAAFHGEVTVVRGQVQQGNFHDYPALALRDCPRIHVEIVASGEHPEGVGEPGTPPIAPAVGNAVFALTGIRLRTLPLRLS